MVIQQLFEKFRQKRTQIPPWLMILGRPEFEMYPGHLFVARLQRSQSNLPLRLWYTLDGSPDPHNRPDDRQRVREGHACSMIFCIRKASINLLGRQINKSVLIM